MKKPRLQRRISKAIKETNKLLKTPVVWGDTPAVGLIAKVLMNQVLILEYLSVDFDKN